MINKAKQNIISRRRRRRRLVFQWCVLLIQKAHMAGVERFQFRNNLHIATQTTTQHVV